MKINLPPRVRIDQYLSNQLGESRSQIQKWIKSRRVYVDNVAITKSGFQTKEIKTVTISIPPPQNSWEDPNIRVPILFETDSFAFIHKPPGITVHPGAGTKNDTLVHILYHQLPQIRNLVDFFGDRPGIVHRLDRETEGIMVIAKTIEAHRRLAQLFASRKVIKVYHTWAWGNFPTEQSFCGYIRRNKNNRKLMEYKEQPPGKLSKMSIFSKKKLDVATLLKVNLTTGRTHQIRTTLQSFNSGVIGDESYAPYRFFAKKFCLSSKTVTSLNKFGMLLASTTLIIPDPYNQKKIHIQKINLPRRFFTIESELSKLGND